MRKLLQNRRKNIELWKALEEQAKQPQTSFEANAALAAILIFAITYVFEIQYLEILWVLVAVSAAMQKWRNIWKWEWYEQWFMEWFDKWCE
jgi:hypothetical protein